MSGPNEISSEIEGREDISYQADALSLSLDENKVREIIAKRIEDGEAFWNKEYDLKNIREKNEKRWLNQNLEVSGEYDRIYDYQLPARDNRIFVSVETLASNIVSKIPVPDVVEAQDSDASRELAQNYGKVLFRKAEDLHLKAVLQMVARHILIGYRTGIAKASWDFDSGRLKDDGTYTGDVMVNFVRPHKIVLDAEATDPNDVPMIAELITKTVEELAFKFPDKKDEIYNLVARERGTPKVNLASPIGYYEVWFSFFDKKGNKAEGVAWKYKDLIFDYGLNPYYNYKETEGKTNFIDKPRKPYVLFNFLNLGKWALDDTSLTEQAASLQDNLEKRQLQIVTNADKANSCKVFNTMMIDAADAQKFVDDPNQNILCKGDVRMAFQRVPPAQLPRFVVEDKFDTRNEIDNIFGTHAPLRGEKSASPTLGQEVMSQRSDLGRITTLMEAMERGALEVYKQMTQLYKVFAKEEQFVKYIGEETGKTTFVGFSRDKIEDGIEIRLQAGSMNPDDKLSDRNEAIELAKIGGRIDPLTFAEKWHIDKPREFAKRLFYFLFMPDKYAQEILEIGQEGGDQDAMQTIQLINSGQNVPPKENPTKEYIAYYNQFIQSPAFKQLDPEVQRLHIEHIRGTVEMAKGALGQPNQPQEQPAQPTPAQPQGGNIISKIKGMMGGGNAV